MVDVQIFAALVPVWFCAGRGIALRVGRGIALCVGRGIALRIGGLARFCIGRDIAVR
jgi:hypothetical protein